MAIKYEKALLIEGKKGCGIRQVEGPVGIYFPGRESVLLSTGQHDEQLRTLQELLIHLMSESSGTASSKFQIFYNSIPKFKKLANDFIKTLKPEYKEGEEVLFKSSKSGTLVVATVGKLLGWKAYCDNLGASDQKTKFTAIREFHGDFGKFAGWDKKLEIHYEPIESYEKVKNGKKFITQLKKGFKEKKMFGVIIHYQGRNYKI